jgi:AraC-like DNA-binding protein
LHERTHVDRVQFFPARDAFRDIAPLLDGALGSTLDTPLGHLLGDYMMALERRLSGVTEADLSRLTTAVGAMIAAAVAPSAERVAVARGQIDVGRKEPVRQAVRRHLRTPTWIPRTCVGLSECPDPISIDCSKIPEASISAIAEDLCFADASSFGRTFRREFAHSPGEMRAATLAGLTPPATLRGPVPSAGADFGELLRGF